jgi:hypothetical protein
MPDRDEPTGDVARPQPKCERCGAPANIHTSNVVGGVPQMRHFCQVCFDFAHIDDPRIPRHWGEAAVIAAAGAVLLTLSLFADWFKFGDMAGFGWHQAAGVMLGGLLVLLGAVARAPTLLFIGIVTGALSLLADWLAFGSSEGFGWQQMLGTGLGIMLLAGAFVVSRTRA